MRVLVEKKGYNKNSVIKIQLLKQNTGLTVYLEHYLCMYISIFPSVFRQFFWCFLAGLYKIPTLFFSWNLENAVFFLGFKKQNKTFFSFCIYISWGLQAFWCQSLDQ